MPAKLTQEEKNLIRRYLIWCYKTTKEAVDRVDRKFTQLIVDEVVLKELNKNKNIKDATSLKGYRKHIADFETYISEKRISALNEKFVDKNVKGPSNPGYVYLKNRLEAVEKAVVYFFDAKELGKIKSMYEEEMTRRILEAREHT